MPTDSAIFYYAGFVTVYEVRPRDVRWCVIMTDGH